MITMVDYVSSDECVYIIHNKKAEILQKTRENHTIYTWYVHGKYLCSL